MKVEITAPDNLNEVTLRQYQEYLRLEEPTTQDVLRIFLNLPNDVIDKIPFTETEKAKDVVFKLFEQEPTHVNIFTFRGVEWGFVPNLDNISYGEYSDITDYFGDWDNMHKAMAVLYRPITKRKKGKYLIEDYEGTRTHSETMLDMPLGITLGAMVFFYLLLNELLKAIPSFIQTQLKKVERSRDFSKSGEDTIKSVHSLQVMCKELEASLSYPFTLV